MSKPTGDQGKIINKDLVLQEVWRAKDELSVLYAHDLDKFIEAMRKREKLSGHRVVNLQKKRKKRVNG